MISLRSLHWMISEKAISCAATCLLLFLSGSMFAIGVLAKAAASDEDWESSVASMALVSAPSMILAGVYLDRDDAEHNLTTPHTMPTESVKTKRVRLLTALGGLGYAALSLGSAENVMLIRFAVSIQGFPLGVFYLLGNELLANWMQEAPGLGIGLGQTAFGLGTIAFSGLFSSMIASYGALSITLSAVLLAVPSWLIGCFIQFPDHKHDFLPMTEPLTDEESVPQLKEKAVKVPWKQLVMEKSFWLYMGIVFTAQAGFAFTPLFFEMGTGFGKPMTLVVKFFQLGTFLGTIARLGVGAVADCFRLRNSSRFSCGSKNVIQLALLAQAILFALLIPMSNQGQFFASMITAGTLLVIYSAANCSCTLLARDMFSTKNSATVFGIGGGLMMGLGEAFAAGVASWFVNKWGAGPRNGGFTLYYVMASAWSLVGLFVAMCITKCQRAFQSPVVGAPVHSACELNGEFELSRDRVDARVGDLPIFPTGETCSMDRRSLNTYHTMRKVMLES